MFLNRRVLDSKPPRFPAVERSSLALRALYSYRKSAVCVVERAGCIFEDPSLDEGPRLVISRRARSLIHRIRILRALTRSRFLRNRPPQSSSLFGFDESTHFLGIANYFAKRDSPQIRIVC